ncbi:MAG: hypothetical protein Q8M76_09460 [Spirochaetaceae bacterium]|nr:hypothetical protein [Spirochaetaceae bacterium]
MKKFATMAIFIALTAALCAQSMRHSTFAPRGRLALPAQGEYAQAEFAAIGEELGTSALGEIRVDQIVSISARMETAISKDAYLRSTTGMSMMMPGFGQLRNGDTLAGAGFLTLHLGTVAGGMAAFYFLMPADLRFDRLDYFSSAHGDIKDAWMAHSIEEYAPAIGAMAAGALLDAGLRLWSAGEAYGSAKEAIDEGRAKLAPIVGPGFLGVKARL